MGVGKHSVGGVARILPAVVRYLTDTGYSFREEPNNPGVLHGPLHFGTGLQADLYAFPKQQTVHFLTCV